MSLQRLEELESEVKQQKKEILARDRVITELRLRLPASAERDAAIVRATTAAKQRAEEATTEDYESEKAVRVAQATVQLLQERINQKEESIQKLQKLLQDARSEMQKIHKSHEDELGAMQKKLHSKHDADLSKLKTSVHDVMSKTTGTPVPTNLQV